MASLWCVSLNATSGWCLSHLLVAPDGEYTYIVVCNIDAVAIISISVAHTLKLHICVFFKYCIIVVIEPRRADSILFEVAFSSM